MTEKDIARAINKHSGKPILFLIIFNTLMNMLNGYFFADAPISPFLLILLAIATSMYILQKVLVELLVVPNKLNNAKED